MTMAKPRLDINNPKVLDRVAAILVEQTPVAYVVLDKKLRVHFLSDFWSVLHRQNRNDLLGNYCYNAFNAGTPCRQCVVQDAILRKERRFVSRKDYLPDGTCNYLDDYAIPLLDADGSFEFLLEVMIDRTAERRIRENNDNLYVGMIEALIAILDKKDVYTSHHSRDVTKISMKLARQIGLSEIEVQDVRLAPLLHDIGKIYIPDAVINKPAALTDDEYRLIKRHPVETLNMLANLSQLADIRLMAGHHHERWDGAGYPDGLRGEDIPLGSRIIAIADTYDAMTTNRPYRKALSHEQAIREILAHAGDQFDPVLARRFVDMVEYASDSRDALLGENVDAGYRRRNHTSVKIERRISSIASHSMHAHHEDANKFFSSRMFVKAIMENSPCFYSIVDEDFNILYASESLIRESGIPSEELYSKHCYEVGQNGEKCFEGESGLARCAALRAFRTGKPQEGKVEYRFKEKRVFCDVYASPLTLKDNDGADVSCVMQIIFDRTKETTARRLMTSDIKSLLEMLMQLVANMDESITAGSEDIIRSCADFSEYLTRMGETIYQPNAVAKAVPPAVPPMR